MTIDEANKLKPGTILRVPNAAALPETTRSEYVRKKADFDRLVLKEKQHRSVNRGPLLIMEGNFMFGLWALDVEIADGPW